MGILSKNLKLKDKHKNQRCFILGNGPSLKSQDLEPLKDEITFAVSAFHNHPIINVWQPHYYCFADPAFFESKEDEAGWNGFFKALKKRIKTSKFIVPAFAYQSIRNKDLLPIEDVFFVQFENELFRTRLYDIDLTVAIPGVWNVIELCIMSALYMGFEEIYLMGVDHDWLSHRGQDRHFYEGNGGMGKCSEAPTDIGANSYQYWMEYQLRVWKGYQNLLKFANYKGSRILNATNGGFLDVFERANYENVVVQKQIHKKETITPDDVQKIAAGLNEVLELKDKPKAELYILQHLNRHPEMPGLVLMEAALAFIQKEFEEVIHVLVHLVKKWPDRMNELNNYGVRFNQTGNVNAAMKLYKIALRIDPFQKTILTNYCKLLNDKKKYQDVVDLCIGYLCKYPQDRDIKAILEESLKHEALTNNKTISFQETKSEPESMVLQHTENMPDNLPDTPLTQRRKKAAVNN